MKKISSVIVKRRALVLTGMLLLTLLCGVLMPQVHINSDMTKYLPDDSSMKQGMDIMEAAFPEAETDNTIRVMMEGLDAQQKIDIADALADIPNVSSVTYDTDSTDYNKDEYTLYKLSTSFDYESPEETAIEQRVQEQYSGFNVIIRNDSTSSPSIPPFVIAMAFLIMMVVLFLSCDSFFEPFLFLGTIAAAIVMNFGTNLLLGEVSDITQGISAILQLVLSMDYSIILMNRFRQELAHEPDKEAAMTDALAVAFRSITSSSVTTIVGLLMLVFMSFKIGADLGFVLAKGVLCSLICVFTILPALILYSYPLIQKAEKHRKGPDVAPRYDPMAVLGRFSYRYRRWIAGVFVVLFCGAYVLQTSTQIAYTLTDPDPIAEIFPADNPIVIVYSNADDAAVTTLAEELKQDSAVKSASSYTLTLGKAYTADELADVLSSMGSDVPLSADLVKLIYYDKFGGEVGTLTTSELLHFVAEDVLTNDLFAESLDPSLSENVEMLLKFADADALTTPMTADELADTFGIDAEQVKQLLLYYYMQKGGVDTGTMTLPVFADFVCNEVAKDPEYGAMFDANTLAQMQMLQTFTDKKAITKPLTPEQAADLLGMDADTAKLLFIYYHAINDSTAPASMTVTEFTDFLLNDIAKSPLFASYLDGDTLAQMQQLAVYTDKSSIERPKTSTELAAMFGMEPAMLDQLFALYYGEDAAKSQAISVPELLTFVQTQMQSGSASMDADTTLSLQKLPTLLSAVVTGKGLTAAEFADVAGIDATMARQLYALYFGQKVQNKTMSLVQFVDFVLEQAASNPTISAAFDAETSAQMQMMSNLMHTVQNGTALSPTEMADLFGSGMDASMLKLLYAYHDMSQNGIAPVSMKNLVDFLAENRAMLADMMGGETAQFDQITLLQALMNGTVSGKNYSAAELANTIGMDADQLRSLYLLYLSRHGVTDSWKISVQTFVDFIQSDILSNPEFADQFDADTSELLGTAKTLVDAVVSGKTYAAAEMADLFAGLSDELDENTMKLLYLYDFAAQNCDPAWTMTLPELLDFAADDLVNDARFASFVDADMRSQLEDARQQLQDGALQLKGEKYSRLILSTTLPGESAETTAFFDTLTTRCAETMQNDYYLIGNSAMVYEMQQTFSSELTLITLLTALSIFLVVAFTFRSIVIPTILVLVVQCGVFITVSVIGLEGMSIYYLALLIVECILMGATIDYGILFTTYYREFRPVMDVQGTVIAAYRGSIHTILTSGSIMVAVTAIVGRFFKNPTISQIVSIVSIGCLSAILLILFLLPGILALCDKLVMGRKLKKEN